MLNSLVTVYRNVADTMGAMPTLLSTITLGFTAFSKQGRELANNLTSAIPRINKLSSAFDGWNLKLKDNKQKLEENIRVAEEYINTNRETGVNVSVAQTKLKGYNSQLASTKIAMAGVKVAATLMNAAISAGLSLLVSWGISAISSVVDDLITTKSELQELNKEFNNTYADTGNTVELIEQYSTLAEQLRNTSRESEEYASISDELSSVENQLLSLYPELNDAIEKNGDLKWKNVEAIQAMTEAELESAKTQARVTLGKNDISGYTDIKAEIDAYNELIKKRREYNQAYDRGEDTVVTGKTWSGVEKTRDINKALEETNADIEEAEERLQAYYNAIRIYGADGAKEFGSALDLLSETLGYTDTQVDTITEGISDMGGTVESTTLSVEKLSESFSAMQAPIEMLRTMIDEFKEFGGLTDETYLEVLDSGNSQLIALLADSANFLENAGAVLEQLETAQADAAKNLIDAAVQEQGMFQGVAESAEDASEAVTQSVQEQANAIEQLANTPQVDTSNLTAQYDELINAALIALDLTGSAAQEMEATVLQALRDYVNEGNTLYTQDVANSLSATDAKAMASEMWLNEDIMKLAQAVLQFKDQYDIDMVNWANDVVNKQTANQTYTNAVLNQIAQMVTLNASNYSADTVNWASALTNKSANNVTMVNNVIQNIAKMILANSSNYNADTVNWANAITNKSTNNANLCNDITSNMANVVNNLASQYGVDAQNFASSTQSKINNIRDLNAAYREMTGSAFGISMRDAFNVDKLNEIKQQVQEYNNKKTNVVTTTTTGSSYVGKTVSGISSVGNVGGSNYVGNVGSASDLKDSSSSSKKTEKEVEDLEDLTDRYYDLNNALQKVETSLDEVETQLETATGKNRIALLEKEITLLNAKRNALANIRDEQNQELKELKQTLASNDFSFKADGQIGNYQSRLDALVAHANSLTGDAKEAAIESVKEVAEQIERYTELLLTDIPSINNQINSITNSISNLRDEIDEIIESTTYFSKDFIDRYYELNNALKQVENQLNAINTAMENADDNKSMELLDKQIELYVKQGEALAAIKKEYEKELSEYNQELYNAGFRFNADGTISNYQSQIEKLVEEANKIMDGDEQEKAIQNIEDLVEIIEKYTDLLLSDIPDITDEIDDLTNAVIDSQKQIADILAKQKEEYIKQLEEETEAYKKEIQRRKNYLEKEWEKQDAEDELAEKQKQLNQLEDDLAVALRVGDEELVKSIREQIADAQKEINDFIRDQERDYISDRFDEDLDNAEEDLESQIDKINEQLDDEALLNLVQSGVRDLSEVLDGINGSTSKVRATFASVGTEISDTWLSALDEVIDRLQQINDMDVTLNLDSAMSSTIKNGVAGRVIEIHQGDFIVEGSVTEDVLPIVQNMIDNAHNDLVNEINVAFSR